MDNKFSEIITKMNSDDYDTKNLKSDLLELTGYAEKSNTQLNDLQTQLNDKTTEINTLKDRLINSNLSTLESIKNVQQKTKVEEKTPINLNDYWY